MASAGWLAEDVKLSGFMASMGQVFSASAKGEMFYQGGFVGVIATTHVNKNT